LEEQLEIPENMSSLVIYTLSVLCNLNGKNLMELVLLLRQGLLMVLARLIHYKWLFMAVLLGEAVLLLMIFICLI
jgi:hypothetical protein